MNGIIAVGLGSYNGGFANSLAMTYCCWACFWGGAILLGAALWHLRRQPEPQTVPVPAPRSPRR